MSDITLKQRSWSLDDLKCFVRPTYFGFTSSQLLMGVAAVTPHPGWIRLMAIFGVAIAFHVFTYVQNDVIDLPIDRTQPLRAEDPLVTGLIAPRTAMTLALLQIPIAFLVTWCIGGVTWAYGALSVGFLFMTIYNIYGKRCPVPMITDAIQGISWGTLAIYGSLVSAGRVNVLSFVAASFGFGFLFLINGVHGGLRDLRNDLASGCATTALYFGAHSDEADGVISTGAVRVFAFIALAVYVGPATIALFSDGFGYGGTIWSLVTSAWVIINIVSIRMLWLITEPRIWNRNQIIRNHAMPLLVPPMILFVPRMETAVIIAMMICFILPFPIFDRPTKDWIRDFLGNLRRTF